MDDTRPKTVRARPLRDFNDAGTERRFTQGVEIDLPEGEFANYEACGLVEAAPAEAASVAPAVTAGGEVEGEAKKRRG